MLRLQNTPQCWKLLLSKIKFKFFTWRRPISWILWGEQILLRILYDDSGTHTAGRAQSARKSAHRSFSIFKYWANPQKRIGYFMSVGFPCWVGYYSLGLCLTKGRTACCSYSRWWPPQRKSEVLALTKDWWYMPSDGAARHSPLLTSASLSSLLINWFYFRTMDLEGAFP